MVQQIIAWYARNKRDLPWRETNNPYIIWLSEVILQQTRVEQGMPYFYRFLEHYPTVADFAAASEDEILKLWQGLGYYSRGRNMHHTAQLVVREFDGHFPSDYNTLLKLKGIGEYTAAAVASFAGNQPRAAVDGNVFRVLARYFGLDTAINSSQGKVIFTKLANQLIDPAQPGIYNQAMMEFGALQCKPQKPDCLICPIQLSCKAFALDLVHSLPVKNKAKPVKQRYFNFIVVRKAGALLMNKRGPNDIWQNLYEFPLFETEKPVLAEEFIQSGPIKEIFGAKVAIRSVSDTVKHLLSHQRIHAQFIEIENFDDTGVSKQNWFYASADDLTRLAQPKLISDFMNDELIAPAKVLVKL